MNVDERVGCISLPCLLPMTNPDQHGQHNPVILEWKTHRLRERPERIPVVALAVSLTACAAAVLYQSWLFGLLGALVVTLALGDYLFPVKHTLRESTASTSCLLGRQEIRWENVKHIWLADDGLKLSPLAHRSRLEVFRGVFLRFRGNREQVIAVASALRDHAHMEKAQAEQDAANVQEAAQ